MRTKYKFIVFPALFALIGVLKSCSLDDSIYNTIIADQYEYTENDVVRILGNAYTPWRGVITGVLNEGDISTDQTVIPVHPWGWTGPGTLNMHHHKWNSETGEATNRWGGMYTGINNANQVIYQIESGLLPITEGKEEYLAELKTVRASYYYMLCDYFGNVPYVTQFDVPEGYLPEQSTRKEIFDNIITEVTQAAPLLSEKVDKSTYGRFTKWAAYALLAKMYLNAEVYTGTPQWDKCLEYCELIIKSDKFKPAENQKDIFKADNEMNSEAIFAIPFDQSYASGLNIFNYALNGQFSKMYNTTGFGGWGGTSVIPQFIETFDPDDSRLKENFLYGQQMYPDGNTMLCEIGESQGKPFNIVNVLPSVNWAEELHGYKMAKYEYVATMNPGAMSNDVFLFRYTDILMMKAECLLRTGHEDDAAEIVTEVRRRAFKTAPAKAAVTGAQLLAGSVYDYGLRETAFSNRVTDPRVTHEGGADILYGRFLDELGWEFNQEGRRRQDMIRFGVFHTKSWLSHEKTNDVRRNLYPIPKSELDKNGKLKQNDGMN